jgi:hypothetical protein
LGVADRFELVTEGQDLNFDTTRVGAPDRRAQLVELFGPCRYIEGLPREVDDVASPLDHGVAAFKGVDQPAGRGSGDLRECGREVLEMVIERVAQATDQSLGRERDVRGGLVVGPNLEGGATGEQLPKRLIDGTARHTRPLRYLVAVDRLPSRD